jgi:hypothetical protein
MRQAGLNLASKRSAWCAAFAAVDITDHWFEWAQIADCMILIVYTDGSVRPLITDYDHDIDTLVNWKGLAEAGLRTRDELWSAIRARAAAKREMMNIDYGILSGEPAAMNFVRHGREPLREVRAVILFSDGLFPPKADPAEPDDLASLGTSIVRDGLHRVGIAVREMERSDPECIRFPRFKTHDDIAALSIVLDE